MASLKDPIFPHADQNLGVDNPTGAVTVGDGIAQIQPQFVVSQVPVGT
jgi:hypothetical protein